MDYRVWVLASFFFGTCLGIFVENMHWKFKTYRELLDSIVKQGWFYVCGAKFFISKIEEDSGEVTTKEERNKAINGINSEMDEFSNRVQ